MACASCVKLAAHASSGLLLSRTSALHVSLSRVWQALTVLSQNANSACVLHATVSKLQAGFAAGGVAQGHTPLRCVIRCDLRKGSADGNEAFASRERSRPGQAYIAVSSAHVSVCAVVLVTFESLRIAFRRMNVSLRAAARPALVRPAQPCRARRAVAVRADKTGFDLDKVVDDLPVPVEYAYAGLAWGAPRIACVRRAQQIQRARVALGSAEWFVWCLSALRLWGSGPLEANSPELSQRRKAAAGHVSRVAQKSMSAWSLSHATQSVSIACEKPLWVPAVPLASTGLTELASLVIANQRTESDEWHCTQCL